jgi:lysophospholipase L1-like esterase
MGNSHTAGYPGFDPSLGGNPESTYEYWLDQFLIEKFPEIKFILENRGVCGLLARQILSRMRALFDRSRPDLIVFWGGANDLVFKRDTETIWNTLWEGFRLSEDRGVPFCLVTIPPMNFEELIFSVKQLNQTIRDNADGNYLCADVYYPLLRNDLLDRKFTVGDGAHLSVHGYRIVGEVIYSTILPLVSKMVERMG